MTSIGRPSGLFALALLCIALTACSAPSGEQLFVYSARHYDSDTLLFDRFTEQTGIEVRVLQGSSEELTERLEREGVASPADVLITVDAGRLWRAEQAGLLEAVDSPLLRERVPEHLRHPEDLWFGFSQRLRLIYYNRERFDPDLVSTYEDLANPELAGRICIRSSNNIYNQSLVASLISHHGVEQTEAWARGLVANLARPPQGGDTDQILGVAAGECDVAVANHYYYIRLMQSDDASRRAAAERVGIIFPNAGDRGVHVNVGGAGMVRGAPNRDNAVRFLEYLASEEAQSVFAGANFEYPVVAGVDMDPAIRAWGELRLDSVAVADLGRYNADAVRLADRVGWR